MYITKRQWKADRWKLGPMASLISGEEKKMVLEVLSLVGDQCKELLIATIYHEMTMKDVVAQGNYSNEQIARNKKYKCLKRLKELVAERPELTKNLMNYGK